MIRIIEENNAHKYRAFHSSYVLLHANKDLKKKDNWSPFKSYCIPTIFRFCKRNNQFIPLMMLSPVSQQLTEPILFFGFQPNWHGHIFQKKILHIAPQLKWTTTKKNTFNKNRCEKNIAKRNYLPKRNRTILLPLFAITFMKIYGHFFSVLTTKKLTQY